MERVFSLKKRDLFLLIVNIFAFGIVGILFYLLNKGPQTPSSLLAPHITMGNITLNVGNIRDMENFYTSMLGMQKISEDSKSVVLGYNKQPVLELQNTPQLPMPSLQDPGLDQIAIVFNSRGGLARVLQRILSVNPALYAGGTGRGAIGEAFYVTDPQGNSLELYYDTDSSTWPRTIKGNVEGNALPIDMNGYIQQYAQLTSDNGMKLGHLQVRIGDITQGKAFYLNTIGFYAVPQIGASDSLFMSDGYYHHDLVINQIQGYDGDPISHYQGLYGFSFFVPNISYLDRLKQRLQKAQVVFTQSNNSITFSDPWGISITVGALSLWPF